MTKYFVILLIMFFSFETAYPQNPYGIKGITPPTPIAEAFKIYGDVPVAYNTGVPDISIPIYTIQVGDFQLPIVLRYHIKSLKPANCKSNVALGWTLDYGGMISRTIYNKPDDCCAQMPWINAPAPEGTGNADELVRIYDKSTGINQVYDSELDMYNYNIPGGMAGEFICPGNQPKLLSRHPISISFSPYDNFDIRDDKGVDYKYGYGKYHMTLSNSWNSRSSWLLSQIVLPSNRNIDFVYQDIPRYTITPRRRQLTINDNNILVLQRANGAQRPFPPTSVTPAFSEFVEPISFDEKNIQEIDFPDGKLVFSLSSDFQLLTGVKIYNKTNLIREYQFILSSDLAMGGMKLLNKVVVNDRSSNTVQQYQIQYYPSYSGVAIPDYAGTDYWGYFNGTTLASFPCGDYLTGSWTSAGGWIDQPYNAGPYCASKDALFMAARSFALQKIIYPSGGSSEFIFGLNQFDANTQGDGLRIEKVINYDGAAQTGIRTFRYIPRSGIAPPFNKREFARMTYDISTCNFPEDPSPTFYLLKTQNEVYDAVPMSRIASDLFNVEYTQISEIFGNENADIGHTEYFYSSQENELREALPLGYPADKGPKLHLSKYRNWDRGLLTRKATYRTNESSPASVDNYYYGYHYEDTIPNTYVSQLTVYNRNSSLGADQVSARHSLEPVMLDPSSFPNVFSYYNYGIVTGWTELQREEHTDFTPEGSVTIRKDYEYNGAQIYYPSKISESRSDRNIKVTNFQYPYDFGNQEPYKTMVGRNILAPRITETESIFNNNPANPLTTLITSKKTTYADWGNNIYKTERMQAATRNNALEDKVIYDAYDGNGNPLQFHKANDLSCSYLWDYNNMYLIAEAINATRTDIAYTSFEADGSGNWSVGGLLRLSGNAVTGSQSYDLINGACSKTGLNTASNYIVSYWSNTGNSFSVTGSMAVTKGKKAGNWTYYEHMVTGAASVSVSGSGGIDELRLYPANGQMTTYSYTPLIGVTNICDALNRVSTYVYDNFGRLQYIRDQDGNIIKTIDYHYQGQ